MTAQPIRSLDDDVAALLDLNDRIDDLESQRKAIRARLAQHPVGTHETSHGVTVTVAAPPRKFNRERGLAMLTEEQRELCYSLDEKKIKEQLPAVLLEQCMDEGAGALRVTLR